jgi:hypothetical protein
MNNSGRTVGHDRNVLSVNYTVQILGAHL